MMGKKKKKSAGGGAGEKTSANRDRELAELMRHISPVMMEQAMGQMFGRTAAATPKTRAQEFYYRAMEAPNHALRMECIEEALLLDPENVDALLVKAEQTLAGEELIAEERRIVSLGEQQLRKQGLAGHRGHYWGIHETRPYMRARLQLAESLWVNGHEKEAISEYEALLELNPNDNQGNRDPLLGAYLATDTLDGARRLLKQYEDDASAIFAWGLVLERFLSGDETGARKALTEARKTNCHVESYLLGQKQMPDQLPGYFGFGDENEAIVCANLMGTAWRRHLAAVTWLMGK